MAALGGYMKELFSMGKKYASGFFSGSNITKLRGIWKNPALKTAATTGKSQWQSFRKSITSSGTYKKALSKGRGIIGPNHNKAWNRLAFGTGTGFTFLSEREKFTDKIKFNQIGMPSSVRSGSGFISWSKTNGMNGNNMSTEGIGLALSKLRHTSTI